MGKWRKRWRWWGAVLTLMGGLACQETVRLPTPTPAVPPSRPPPVASPLPPETPWVTLAPGLATQELAITLAALSRPVRLIAFRVDPTQTTWRVHYEPAHPRLVSAWAPEALLVINAGFFDAENRATARVVADGQGFGQSYVDFGGMLQVEASGQTRLRSLVAEPYDPTENLQQVVQSFPMLIYPDGTPYARTDPDRARRTALAQDAAGQLYVFIAPNSNFTLAELASTLQALDWNLTLALNLDGGGSTGFHAVGRETLDSFTPVPAVIAVYGK